MNEIHFTHAEMSAAMAHYLNSAVLKNPVKVTNVEYKNQNPGGGCFVIKTAPADDVKTPRRAD